MIQGDIIATDSTPIPTMSITVAQTDTMIVEMKEMGEGSITPVEMIGTTTIGERSVATAEMTGVIQRDVVATNPTPIDFSDEYCRRSNRCDVSEDDRKERRRRGRYN